MLFGADVVRMMLFVADDVRMMLVMVYPSLP